jgi:Na+/H+ antiporter NhaC
MASATDHIDHVRTQLPYALLAAALATAGFLALGMIH